MSFIESEEQTMVRESVRKIVAGYGHDYYTENSRNGGSMTGLWDDLGKGGFIGVNIPEQYGGGGMGLVELATICEELAAGGCPMLIMIVSPAICGSIIAQHGTDAQRETWLPRIAGGDMKMAFAITEPDAGSNSHNLATQATRDGDEYILRGTKYYISAADEADAILVVARTGQDEATGRGQLSLFIVDTNAPGLEQSLIPVEIVSPERQYTLFFDDVRVPADRLIGTEHDGLHQVFTGLNPERITGAAIGCGIGRYALDKASVYANERVVWKTPIGAHQGIAHPLAEGKIQLELARLMTQKAAWLFDQGSDAAEAANMAKFSGAEAGIRCLDQAIQTHGGNGMASEYGLASMWGMARLLRTAPVSREMILNYIALHSLGLPRSY